MAARYANARGSLAGDPGWSVRVMRQLHLVGTKVGAPMATITAAVCCRAGQY